MNNIATMMNNALQLDYSTLMELLVFLATGTLAFSVMAFARVRNAVKRRATGIRHENEQAEASSRSLRYSSLKAVSKLLEYTTKHYGTVNDENMKILRRRLIQAGIYDSRAVAYFFITRTALAVGIVAAIFMM